MTPQELKYAIPIFRDGNIYIIDGDIEHCVMYGNEELYIKESIKEICKRIKPKSVIEFGFGLGFTAQQFQDEGIELHIIYEPNDVIYQKALEWSIGKNGVIIINSRFEDAPMFFKVDLIYNDIYGMCNNEYAMSDFDDAKDIFNFDWYAEFCSDYEQDMEIPDNYFRFKIGEYDKIQPLIKK